VWDSTLTQGMSGAALRGEGATVAAVSAQEGSSMQLSQSEFQSSTGDYASLSLRGHKPALFKGQKAAFLGLLLSNRGQWVPADTLAVVALQYSSRIVSLRREGFQIEDKTERVAGKVHGAFKLVACPGEQLPLLRDEKIRHTAFEKEVGDGGH
jgi:hypothetical protein